MAERRMMSKKIIDSDAFMDMPLSTQSLYFHLLMRADDDGFVGNPKKIMRMINANDDDYKLLMGKRFILLFPSGVCVIKHWLIHNYIQNDRYNPSQYHEEKKLITTKENSAYTECIQDVSTLDTQVRLGKVRLGKVSNPEWLDLKSWEEWEQHRREIKKTLTPSTREKQIKFLEEHKDDQKHIINQSITNGWTGLFPLKEGKNTNTPRTFIAK